jgi:hypothetical protein
MRPPKLKQALHLLAATAALSLAACGGGDKNPTGPGPEPEPGDGVVAEFALARIGFVGLPAYLNIEDCAPTRFTGGAMRFYDDGSWEFAVAIQNDFGDTRFDNAGWYEQEGGALWFEAEDGETFQGTIDEDGVIAIDYDYCQNGQTDIQLVFAR